MTPFKNARQRMEALVHGEKLDQIPVALWHHFPVDDQDAGRLAAATISFQQTFNFDLVKVSPSSSFCLEDWGIQDEWRGHPEGTREHLNTVIHHPEDWKKLKKLDAHKGGLGRQLECLKMVRDAIGAEVPLIQTIFSPLSQAKNLIGKANLPAEMRRHPDALKAGLDTITETTADFIEACKQLGIDGVFFAVQHASYNLVTKAEFDEFAKTYDQRLFPLIEEFWLNMLHIHGTAIMPEAVVDYPMQIFNWHDRDTLPNLADGKKLFNKVVCGGLGRIETMLLGDDAVIKAEIDDAVRQTNGEGFILGTGCVMMQTTPYGNIRTAIDHVRSIPVK
ncbi:MAG: uroporphyrinogen decarboxylase [Chloroflexota bacterium]|nr:uroporphyrinogen decarboxylase [Chloroflexota bacterium]